jgi:hypothetical protein
MGELITVITERAEKDLALDEARVQTLYMRRG